MNIDDAIIRDIVVTLENQPTIGFMDSFYKEFKLRAEYPYKFEQPDHSWKVVFIKDETSS